MAGEGGGIIRLQVHIRTDWAVITSKTATTKQIPPGGLEAPFMLASMQRVGKHPDKSPRLRDPSGAYCVYCTGVGP